MSNDRRLVRSICDGGFPPGVTTFPCVRKSNGGGREGVDSSSNAKLPEAGKAVAETKQRKTMDNIFIISSIMRGA